MKKFAIAIAAAATLFGANAAQAATTLWDNGGPAAASNWCSSSGYSCGGLGWNIYDDFSLTAASTISGFTYNSYYYSGSYNSTNWSIWASNPVTSFAAGPLFSGNSIGTNTATGSRTALTTVTGLNISLASGTYWLGIQNNANGGLTSYITSGQTLLNRASQSTNSGIFYNPSISDAAFTIQGSLTSAVAAVPEPATWALMILGFGVVAHAMRRAKAQAKAQSRGDLALA
ncbi:PEP-CTERM sorting domain-containing protein [Novosphingobium umbonatum]|uniref:PEP-CTERM sorting domain-containing protein n=1 Tax=Novosphingobium umbonatum TaxID=1908524 RepID=A0A3S2Y5B1_9SPHN|nr:PEPxxWA-CTERM sorting domain-containing protein [Novosphingobium umbonatum]RVU03853.1 PEP-CTERM sorting domain-containing protein [Novosphingobium umbonatum]